MTVRYWMARLSIAALLFTLGPASWGAVLDERLEALQSSGPDFDSALEVAEENLDLGAVELQVEAGVLVPIVAAGTRTGEWIFHGTALLIADPPNEIEAQQLELFSGHPNLREPISGAVFLVDSDRILPRLAESRSQAMGPNERSAVESIFSRWTGNKAYDILAIEGWLLRRFDGDPAFQEFVAASFESEDLGQIHYLVDPTSFEPAVLGQFVPLDLSQKEERTLAKTLRRSQRRGRLLGLDIDDLGTFDTWMTSAEGLPRQRSMSGEVRPESGEQDSSPFRPIAYDLDVDLSSDGLELRGRVVIDLVANHRLSRSVPLQLERNLKVEQVHDADGRPVSFWRRGTDLLVFLEETPVSDQELRLSIQWSGRALISDKGKGSMPLAKGRRPVWCKKQAYALASTTTWYPQLQTQEKARYAATFHWPKHLELLSVGQEIDQGESGQSRWKRFIVNQPTFAIGFEVGQFEILTGHGGIDDRVKIEFAFDPCAGKDLGISRESLLEAAARSIRLFEEEFGAYPRDELRLVIIRRSFSQSLQGFITLSLHQMVNTVGSGSSPRTIIAHEVAHQWWGHDVGWKSYRDQWLSESLANYSSTLFNQEIRTQIGHLLRGPYEDWSSQLLRHTEDRRTIESLGPVTLGVRLASSKAPSAQISVMYVKGGMTMDVLSRLLGRELFTDSLAGLVEAARNRDIDTEEFIDFVQRYTNRDLSNFARQYIWQTGLPQVFYNYRPEKTADGGWQVVVEATQAPTYRPVYVARRTERGVDIQPSFTPLLEIENSLLPAPFSIQAFHPELEERKSGQRAAKPGLWADPRDVGNVTIRGRLLLEGAKTKTAVALDHEPIELWLDRDAEALALFYHQGREPKRTLLAKSVALLERGSLEDALEAVNRALDAPLSGGPAFRKPLSRADLRRIENFWNRLAQIQQANLLLLTDRDREASVSIKTARRMLRGPSERWLEIEVAILEARLALRQGDAAEAYEKIVSLPSKRRNGITSEAAAILALAARETGRVDEYEEVLELLKGRNVDLSSLADR